MPRSVTTDFLTNNWRMRASCVGVVHGGIQYTGDSTGLFLRPAIGRKNGGSVKEAFVS
jgi:hypothetical protein